MNLAIIVSDNDLLVIRHQAVISLSETLIAYCQLDSLEKRQLKLNENKIIQENGFKMSTTKPPPFCVGLNILRIGGGKSFHCLEFSAESCNF